jgi:hypothetical protein
VAVVDDTVYGGGGMARAKSSMGGREAVYAAVYARPEAATACDVYARLLPAPHLLEWNIMNNGPFVGNAASTVYGGGVGLDLDGVILHDEVSGGKVGTPFLVPRTQACRLIATGRSERHRSATESELKAAGVRWERLEMLPDDVPLTPETAAEHKARHYARSNLGFFVESDYEQSKMIFNMAKKPVICPIAKRVWQ